MKRPILLILLITTVFHLAAQDWLALGDGTGTNQKIIALESFQGKLIAGGSFILAGGQVVNHIAQWDGSVWQPMGSGFDDEVRSLAVFNGELYAAGRFNNDGSGTVPFSGMAKWNGTQWLSTPVPDPLSYDYRALYVLNGALFATKHTYYTDFAVKVSKFDGLTWTDLPGQFTGPVNYKYLYTLGEYNGNLLAGGVFDSVNGIAAQRMAMFDGNNWVSLDFPVPGPSGGVLSGNVFAFAEFEGKLFAGGIFANFQDTIAGTSAASFDGTNWKAYPFDGNLGGIIYDFKILDSRLIAGGDFGYWQGSNIVSSCVMFDTLSPNKWSSLNFYNAMGSSNLNVQGLAIVNGTLYVGGRFDYAGSSSLPVHNIARFNGDFSTGISVALKETNLLVLPNPATDKIYFSNELFLSRSTIPAVIFNATGNVVLHKEVTGAGLNISNLIPGIYTIIFETGTGNTTARFMKL